MQVLTVTDAARREILDMRKIETAPETLALKVEVVGSSGTEFTYDLTFEPMDALDDDDALFDSGTLPVTNLPADGSLK